MHPALARLLAENRGRRQFKFRQFVLPQHKLASDAAPIALMAAARGLFDECHTWLMSGEKLTKARVEEARKKFAIGGTPREVGDVMKLVARDIMDAGALGIRAVPALFLVNKDGEAYRVSSPEAIVN